MFLKLHHSDGSEQLFRLTRKSTIVGRHPDCEVNLNDPAVSRHHFQIYQVGENFFAEDLNSNNGTVINGRTIDNPTRLYHLDSILCCDFQLTFVTEPDSASEFEGTRQYKKKKRSKEKETGEGSGSEKVVASLSTDSQSESKRLAHNTEAKLRALSTISSDMGGMLDGDHLVSHLLTAIFNLYPQARSAVVLLVDPRTRKPNIAGQRNHKGEDEINTPLSSTIVKRVMETGDGILIENVLKDKQFESSESLQTSLIRSMICVPWKGQDGHPAGIIHIDTDIPGEYFTKDDLDVSTTVAAQAGLAFQRARLYEEVHHAYQYANRIVETARSPLVVVNAGFQVVTANRSFYERFGLKLATTEGKELWELGDGQWNHPSLRSRLEQTLTTNRELIDLELEAEFPKTGRHVLLISARRIREDSRVARSTPEAELLISIQDITMRVQAEEKVHELNTELSHASRSSLIGTMAAGIAHELHQPLTSIVNFSGGCQTVLEDDSRVNGLNPSVRSDLLSSLQDIESEAMRCGKVMKSIRNFIKRREVNRQFHSIKEIISDAIKLARLSTDGGDIQLNTDVDNDLPDVWVDKIQVTQVILNLLVNAFEAINEQPSGDGKVTLRCALTEDNDVEVTVYDTGPGIKEEILERVFNQFITTKDDGLGIGLAISRTIAEAHGKQLNVDSNSDNGTAFSFTLGTREAEVSNATTFA
ncbi:MAG: hypothetical protein CMJ78_17625 [Planctomycetaceae bacterium]|nr:hypothetical protein [Planctomycetaceae bacterium]